MGAWSQSQSARLCGIGEESVFINKAILLDRVQFSSVRKAVSQLNEEEGETLCPRDFCVVFSVSEGEYYLLYKEGKRWEAFTKLGLGSPAEKSFRILGAAALCMCSLAFRILGETVLVCCEIVFKAPKRNAFDMRKLAGGVHKGLLTERYDVIKQLGAGAQGAAYLVKRKFSAPSDEFLVAKGTVDEKGASFLATMELKSEFEKMQRLRHPNCIKVIELVESTAPRQVFIVSEFASGGDLYKFMHEASKEGGMTEGFVTSLFEQAMQGVAYLHNEGYLHNDLKPDNILVMGEFSSSVHPRVVIGDFGCATRFLGGQRVCGDPRYMAPECLRAFAALLKNSWSLQQPATSPKSDVWSMGATLYELLSGGTIPFLYTECVFPIAGNTFALLEEAVCGLEELRTDDVSFHTHEALSLLRSMLRKEASIRPNAQEVLKHDWFQLQHCTQETAAVNMPDIVMKNINLIASQKRVRQVLLTALAATLRYEHVKTCHAIFRELDPENKGTINHESFSNACRRFRAETQDIEDIFQAADITKTDNLEFNEFVALTLDWQTLDEQILDRRLEELISKIGGRADGVISLVKLGDFFEGALDSDQLQEALAGLESCDGQTVTKTELKRFILSKA